MVSRFAILQSQRLDGPRRALTLGLPGAGLAAVSPLPLAGVLFLLLEWAAIAIYAGLGAYLQRWFCQPGPRRLFNRVSASLLGCAGLGLLAARRA